ncbi:MAG: type II toxin-antitoxin system RelE/ParE family toxin [Spirochaetaceae bacterium]|nr:type II toxin-antitoxin system RelE/ParE family toxin [Spirochaetaceae bacterium]
MRKIHYLRIIDILAIYDYNLGVEVKLTKQAQSYLDKLPKPDKVKINNAIDGLKQEPPLGDIKQYKGTGYDTWRLKATSKYRIIYEYYNNSIVVTHIAPRGQAYTKKTRG